MDIRSLGGLSNSSVSSEYTIPTLTKSLSESKPNDQIEEKAQPATREDINTAITKANHMFEALTTHLKFQYHEGTERYYISVVNDETDEVVREIPPKKFLDMVAMMEKMVKGIFVDEKK